MKRNSVKKVLGLVLAAALTVGSASAFIAEENADAVAIDKII